MKSVGTPSKVTTNPKVGAQDIWDYLLPDAAFFPCCLWCTIYALHSLNTQLADS